MKKQTLVEKAKAVPSRRKANWADSDRDEQLDLVESYMRHHISLRQLTAAIGCANVGSGTHFIGVVLVNAWREGKIGRVKR